MLSHPLPDLAAWTRHFQGAPIPVLSGTAQAIEAMRPNEDHLDAHSIAELIGSDPLMTLKLLRRVSEVKRSSRFASDTETVTAALVFLGVPPFFRTFTQLLTVEDLLHDQPEAMQGLRRVLRRARRAANFSLGFAAHRADPDAAVLYEAALLHDFAEMLLWCHAPALALDIFRRQQADPTLRSAQVQRDVLHLELVDLEQALMQAWQLPELLIRVTDDRHAKEPQVRNVALAIRLARHTQQDWDNAALPDDIEDIADLLNLSPAAVYTKVAEIDR